MLRPHPGSSISKLETTGWAEALAGVFDRVIIGLDRIIGGKLVIISNTIDSPLAFLLLLVSQNFCDKSQKCLLNKLEKHIRFTVEKVQQNR